MNRTKNVYILHRIYTKTSCHCDFRRIETIKHFLLYLMWAFEMDITSLVISSIANLIPILSIWNVVLHLHLTLGKVEKSNYLSEKGTNYASQWQDQIQKLKWFSSSNCPFLHTTTGCPKSYHFKSKWSWYYLYNSCCFGSWMSREGVFFTRVILDPV